MRVVVFQEHSGAFWSILGHWEQLGHVGALGTSCDNPPKMGAFQSLLGAFCNYMEVFGDFWRSLEVFWWFGSCWGRGWCVGRERIVGRVVGVRRVRRRPRVERETSRGGVGYLIR